MLRFALTALALVVSTPGFARPGQSNPEAEGRPPTAEPTHRPPPALVVARPTVEVAVTEGWQEHDVRALCGVEAGAARVRIEEVSGPDARAAADVALAGPTTLRLRKGSRPDLVVELSATDADGHQSFDRCHLKVR